MRLHFSIRLPSTLDCALFNATICFSIRISHKQSPVNPDKPTEVGRNGRYVDILGGFSWIQKMVLFTTSSVVLSWLVMMLYDAAAIFFGAIGTSKTTLIIGTVTPLVVAPIVSWHFIHVMQELRSARNLAQALAITDVMTGVFNRRHFMAHAQVEFAKAQRYKTTMSIIILDIDHFKSFNDTYGHSPGDDVLVGVCREIAKCLREPDVLARYGGEEFIVLLPQTGSTEAMLVAERIRKEVERFKLLSADRQFIQVTICLGVAVWQERTTSLATLLKSADDALYQGKALGQNQSVLAD